MRMLVGCLALVVAWGGDESSEGAAGRGGGGWGVKAEAGRASGGSGAGAGSGGMGGARSETGMIELVPNVIAGQQLTAAGGTAGIGSSGSALRIGSPSASNLLSLKYYVMSIRLCED